MKPEDLVVGKLYTYEDLEGGCPRIVRYDGLEKDTSLKGKIDVFKFTAVNVDLENYLGLDSFGWFTMKASSVSKHIFDIEAVTDTRSDNEAKELHLKGTR
jgi:hypothetical protein